MPFVVYRKPNKKSVSALFSTIDSLTFTNSFTESGFVFAPFDNTKKAILFSLENSEYINEKTSLDTLISDDKKNNLDEKSKKNHIKLVDKTIKEIKNNDLKKVVVSREELVALSDFNLINVFQKLLSNYKNAFVYIWFHPKIGLWLGATPETLLEVNNSTFKTMSLAGTQLLKNVNNVVWKNKELEEQQLVTDFIENQLRNISTNLTIDKTETVKAGSLLHLKTKVTGKLLENSNLKTLIRALHPTPAVCGLPREKAKKFIVDNENYKRTYYTGFLGEINFNPKSTDKSSSLFVNLRCMSIENKTASIFVGGGITKDSNSKKEWEETVAKSSIMKRVL